MIADCGHSYESPGHGAGAAGYAVTSDGSKICYACADVVERLAVHRSAPGDRTMAYLSIVTEHPTRQVRRLTTWTGGTLARVVSMRETRSGFGRSRYYGRAVDADGRVWSFNSSGPGMYARLRLTKGVARGV
jgi:streptogramin lyase